MLGMPGIKGRAFAMSMRSVRSASKVDSSAARNLGLDGLFHRLQAAREGMNWSEAAIRLEQFGPNVAVSQRVPPWASFPI